jgi:tRNA dimethylallyltransferase
MMAGGFVEEVVNLRAAGYGSNLKSMQSLGYRHLFEFLDGRKTLAAAVEELKRDTRRFAKRQISWFKADPRVREIGIESEPMAEAVADYIVEDLRKLDTTLSSVDGKKEA